MDGAATARPWRHRALRAGRWLQRIAVALAGALLGVLLLARIDAPVGPFDASMAFRPVGGGAQVGVPPLGSLLVDVYDGPLRLDIQVRRVDQERATELARDPVRLAGIVDEVAADLRSGVVRLAAITAVGALGGGGLLSWLVLRRRREPLIALGVVTAVLAGTAGLGAATWRPQALSQPTYTGLLVNADSLIGSAEDIAARFDAYRASLEELVSNVGTLYSALSALPPPLSGDQSVALLHVSDLHLNPAGFDLMRQVADQFGVDAVLDTGDITDWGSESENRLITAVGGLDMPYVYVRGNHDSATTAALIAAQPNAAVLDDSAVTVAGISIIGAADPRFTPDKRTGDDEAGVEVLDRHGEELASFAATLPQPPDIALVHDPRLSPPLDGVVPLVLAGHTHEREVSRLEGGTVLMAQGSTGGAGLRGLQGEFPEPLACTVLYLDPDTGALRAYDDITLGGLGATEVTIERTVVEPAAPTPDDGGGGDGQNPAPDGATPVPDGTSIPAPTSPGG